jgi:hypothetical protein
VTHSRLLRSVWRSDYGGELEYLWAFILQLRKKLENAPSSIQVPADRQSHRIPVSGYRAEDGSGTGQLVQPTEPVQLPLDPAAASQPKAPHQPEAEWLEKPSTVWQEKAAAVWPEKAEAG